MLCDICHKNIATVHLTEIVNSKIAETHICQVCAQAKAGQTAQQPNVSDFLSGLLSANIAKKEEQSLKCPACGFNYSDFKKKGRLGCGRCYSAFKRQLLPLLKKIHGTIRHTGKVPLDAVGSSVQEVKLKDFEKQLQRAVELEEYEDAARIRDEIKKFQGGHK
ncbi:MAG: UvrB/UvrC motif-containing protein [Candidatus Omnitrophica bacterium]|nr:UvrB/UvrC motif-containing protein [Candidatus Omnitrophota bacterium]MBU2473311.1 UvrB/UvrC motif-containing protein [Candidatus Omnitrophota bacterium]